MSLTIGSLFTGYGGLDQAVSRVLDAETAWVADIDKGSCKVLAHRYPDVPNLGDVTAIDWSIVQPVDIITGGSPCQDLSHAGKRAGMTEGTRSNLWVTMREAIATIRPRLVIWENVGGAYSARAASELESREGLLGDGTGRPGLRALGRVLGDLASLGYVGGWHGLRASDVGAPHGRLRVFVVAIDADAQRGGRDGWTPDPLRGQERGTAAAWSSEGALLPSPRTSDTNGAGQHGQGGVDLRTAVSLLPTPRATDGTKGGPNQRGSSGDLMLPSAVHLLGTPTARDCKGSGQGERLIESARRGQVEAQVVLLTEAQRLLPTPRASDGPEPSSHGRTWSATDRNLHTVAREDQWGQYAAAIHRWETVLGRPAPEPTVPSTRTGRPQLSPRFTEWMMGLPDGWITDTPDVTRNEALRMCGNGVVQQQAEAAIRLLLPIVARLGVAA